MSELDWPADDEIGREQQSSLASPSPEYIPHRFLITAACSCSHSHAPASARLEHPAAVIALAAQIASADSTRRSDQPSHSLPAHVRMRRPKDAILSIVSSAVGTLPAFYRDRSSK